MAKPASGTPLNTGHALYTNITAAYLLGEGSGSTSADSKGSKTLTLDAVNDSWTTDSGDACIAQISNSADVTGLVLASALNLPGTGSWSIAWRGKQTNNDNQGMLMGDHTVTTDFLWFQGTVNFSFRSTGNTTYSWTGTTNFTTKRNYVLTYDQPNAKLHFYVNGVEDGTGLAVTANDAALNITTLTNAYLLSVIPLVGQIDYCYIWTGRILTSTEVGNINTSPYDMFSAGSSIVVIDKPVEFQGYQISGGIADIPIKGRYTTGSVTPTAIQARFNGGAWATIDMTPNGSDFAGTLFDQAAGTGALDVKFANDATVTDTVTPVRLTNWFGWGGDSRPSGRLNNLQAGAVSALDLNDHWVGADPVSSNASTGTFCPLISALHNAKFGYPCGFVTAGLSSTDVYGSGVNQWAIGQSSYNVLVGQCSDAGQTGTGTGTGTAVVSGIKGMIMMLGPNAIAASPDPDQPGYNAALDAMVNGFANAIPGAPATILDVCGQYSPAGSDAGRNAVRMAVYEARGDNANVVGTFCRPEASYSDGVHEHTDAEGLTVARRCWMAMENAWFGGTYGRGPRKQSITINASLNQITVTFDRTLANLATLDDAGFTVKDGVTTKTVATVTSTGSQAIIALATPCTAAANVTVSLHFGDNSVGKAVPTSVALTLPDSNTEVLPAEHFINATLTQAGGFRPWFAARSNQLVGKGGVL